MLQTNDEIRSENGSVYTLKRKLGGGTFGEVWLANKHSEIGTKHRVALKFLDEKLDRLFIIQEIELWEQVKGHSNVVPIIEAFHLDSSMVIKQTVIVSEYMPDGSLGKWLEGHGGKAPSIDAVVSMAVGILNGLQHLHTQKVVHLDIKPDNVLLQGETPRLVDFGLARTLKPDAQSLHFLGTPKYMAPETFERRYSEQSDLWSAGVVIHELLTGFSPFQWNSGNPTWDLAPFPSSVPRHLCELVTKSLKVDPKQRYGSAQEMRTILQSGFSATTKSTLDYPFLEKQPLPFDEVATKVANEDHVPSVKHLYTKLEVPLQPDQIKLLDRAEETLRRTKTQGNPQGNDRTLLEDYESNRKRKREVLDRAERALERSRP